MSDALLSFPLCVVRFSGLRQVRNCDACFRVRFSCLTCMNGMNEHSLGTVSKQVTQPLRVWKTWK